MWHPTYVSFVASIRPVLAWFAEHAGVLSILALAFVATMRDHLPPPFSNSALLNWMYEWLHDALKTFINMRTPAVPTSLAGGVGVQTTTQKATVQTETVRHTEIGKDEAAASGVPAGAATVRTNEETETVSKSTTPIGK